MADNLLDDTFRLLSTGAEPINELEIRPDGEGHNSSDDGETPHIDADKNATSMTFYPRASLMGIPAELRLIIYGFAMQDNIDTITSTSSIPPWDAASEIIQITKKPLPYLGGLVLNHANRVIRRESLAAFLPLLKAHESALWEHSEDLRKDAQAARRSQGWKKMNILKQANACSHWIAVNLLVVRAMHYSSDDNLASARC